MTRLMERAVPAIAIGLLVGAPAPALAYNWATHRDIVGNAVSIMQNPPTSPVAPAPPPGVSAEYWNQFLAMVVAGPSKLGVLRTGLPNKLPAGSGGGIDSDEAYPSNLAPFVRSFPRTT